jgi:flagellar basal-body rod protein FlgG
MNYGLYTSASGLMTSMFRMDTASNNLANIDTPGFKVDHAAVKLRASVREEDGIANLPSNALLERLGSGTLLMPVQTSFSQGNLRKTGNSLDVAIEGDGFLAVRTGTSGDASERIRLTRDGRMTLNAEGRLVTAADGLPVLDTADQPIPLDPRKQVEITPSGEIFQQGTRVAQLQLTDVPDRTALTKQGGLLLAMTPEAAAARTSAAGQIRQKHIESSAVDSISALMGVTNAASAANANTRMIQLQDELLSRLISTVGRVS